MQGASDPVRFRPGDLRDGSAGVFDVEKLAWVNRHYLKAAAPARLARLDTRTGRIAEGMDADLIAWDPDASFDVDPARLRQRHKCTPYAGRRLKGRVAETYVRGRLVYREDQQ